MKEFLSPPATAPAGRPRKRYIPISRTGALMALTKLPLHCRPAEGFYASEVAAPNAWPLRTFMPLGYEPNYPYPLLVFLHGHGSNEENVLRLAPRLSRRNYLCIAPRGPHPVSVDRNGNLNCSWGPDDQDDPSVEEYVFRAIEQTMRAYHVHSERIYLVGFREGAALAYRLALLYPDKFAGVASLNGSTPSRGGPLLRLPEVRQLKVFIGHGIANAIVPMGTARKDQRLFYSAGLDVRMRTYPTTHRIHPEMLRDLDRWVQDHISDERFV
jgi:phospholipase/carboxylesterase